MLFSQGMACRILVLRRRYNAYRSDTAIALILVALVAFLVSERAERSGARLGLILDSAAPSDGLHVVVVAQAADCDSRLSILRHLPRMLGDSRDRRVWVLNAGPSDQLLEMRTLLRGTLAERNVVQATMRQHQLLSALRVQETPWLIVHDSAHQTLQSIPAPQTARERRRLMGTLRVHDSALEKP